MAKLKIRIFDTDVKYEGSEKFLRKELAGLLETITKSHNKKVKRNLLDTVEELQRSLTVMESSYENTRHLNEELNQKIDHLREQFAHSLIRIKQLEDIPAEVLTITKQMKEDQMSFNLQYLQLQNQMQNENRQFTMVSNIMNTKHDTGKNSIGNIR